VADIVRSIEALPLTPGGWGPFGWIPVRDTDPADGRERLAFEWTDVHLNVISHAPQEIARTAQGLLCDRLYRHDTHTQALLILDVASVIVVAPADVGFSDPSDVGTLRAFLLAPLDSFVLHRGTWHWGPFPIGDRPVTLYNVQGLRYAEDNAMVNLAEKAMAVEVRAVA
jgi:ureidoglycolate hydrolase